jgi:glutathione S-transferase
MKIFGHPMSTCTRKVLMTLAETNTPYELEVVEFATGEHKKPAHLTRQPFGQVPALKDGDFELYESRAMCRYINDKVGGALVPSDLKDRAKMEQWISVETSNFTAPAMKFIYQHIFQRPQTPETIATATEQLNAALTVMDQTLANQPYLVGKSLSLADVCFMPYFEYAMKTPAKDIVGKYPNVSKWWDHVSSKPTWKKAIGASA